MIKKVLLLSVLVMIMLVREVIVLRQRIELSRVVLLSELGGLILRWMLRLRPLLLTSQRNLGKGRLLIVLVVLAIPLKIKGKITEPLEMPVPILLENPLRLCNFLLDKSTLAAEIGVTATATIPFVITGEYTDSVYHSGPCLPDHGRCSYGRSGSALDEPNVCYSLVDQLAPPMFFSQLHAMEYDQLFTEFNIGAAHQTCLGAEVGMRFEYVLRGKKRLEGKCGMKANLLKEMDTEIAGLKAQLSLKEVEAVEAIRLRSRIADIKATDATLTGELKSLKERNVALESAAVAKDYEITKLTQDLSSLQLSCDDLSVKASTLECEKDKLVDQVSELEATCFGLRDEVMGYKLFKKQVEAVQHEQVKALSDLVAHIDSDLMGALGHAIDKGMQDSLKVGVDYGRAGRGLDVIAAYDPSAKANFVFAVDALQDPATETPKAIQLQASFKQLMVPIHWLKDQVVIRETSLSFALDVAHLHVQRLKGDDAACCLSLTDVMVLLLEALSIRSLTGEAITSMVPSTAVTNALSTTFVQANTIPTVPYTEVPPSPNIVFEEELDTIRCFPLQSLSFYAPLPSAFVTSYGPSHFGPSFPLSFAWLESLFWYTRIPLTTAYRLDLRRMALAFSFSIGSVSSMRTYLFGWAKLVDVILLTASAFLFSLLGTCLIDNFLKPPKSVFTFSKYSTITGSLAIASYPASLLVASNLNIKVNPAPCKPGSFRICKSQASSETIYMDDPSVNNVYGSGSSSSASIGVSEKLSSGRSTMKLANIFPLTVVLGLYLIPLYASRKNLKGYPQRDSTFQSISASTSFSTSSCIALFLSGAWLLFFCLTDEHPLRIFSLCSAMCHGTPVISASFQANMSRLRLSSETIVQSSRIILLLRRVSIPPGTRNFSILPIGHMISLLKPMRGAVARIILLFTFGRSLLKQCSYSISEADHPSTYIRCMKCPPISASMIIGPCVLSSSPEGVLTGGGALNLPLFRAKISFRDFVRSVNLSPNDNAYHSIPEGLRRTRAYLAFLRFALSLFSHCVSHGGCGWGEIELRWSTHGVEILRFPNISPTIVVVGVAPLSGKGPR
nr:hypothetical protein [Tanacetum cinerariifolium]